ncbi:MAG: DUF3126 family protein [Sphingomonadales bacterium]|jgi:hypothetical protein
MTPHEIGRLQKYLRTKFDNNRFVLKPMKTDPDALEVYLGEEFIGVVYRDDEEGELSYPFQMAILEEDLPDL